MQLCNETVTVYNARVDPARRMEVYAPTVLEGVSWHSETVSAVVDSGLKAANRFTLRIPEAVKAGGRTYVEPAEYRTAPDVSGLWTLQKGDVIVKAACTDVLDPARLRERFGADRVLTVVGVTDDRRAPRGKHWKVTGA